MRYKKDIKKLLIRLSVFFILIFSIILILSGNYLLPSNSILRIGTNEFIIHFDPYKYNKTTNLSLNQHIFESLVSIDNTGKIKPLLAENWFNIDDKTWIFNIRKNVYFSNGDHLTADDVIYSFERVRIDINSEINSNFDINLAISKIEKINDYRIKIVTETIFPTLLLKL
ncbi:MAG: ABC transporter substrate-binding protein, partial [Spirochaetota bacterium]